MENTIAADRKPTPVSPLTGKSTVEVRQPQEPSHRSQARRTRAHRPGLSASSREWATSAVERLLAHAARHAEKCRRPGIKPVICELFLRGYLTRAQASSALRLSLSSRSAGPGRSPTPSRSAASPCLAGARLTTTRTAMTTRTVMTSKSSRHQQKTPPRGRGRSRRINRRARDRVRVSGRGGSRRCWRRRWRGRGRPSRCGPGRPNRPGGGSGSSDPCCRPTSGLACAGC
jgi:hypothetical protein